MADKLVTPTALCQTLAETLAQKHSSILDEAKGLVENERREAYGDARASFKKIAIVWSEILGRTVTPSQVCLMMIALKTLREANKHQRDNLVDIAGYASLAQTVASDSSPTSECDHISE